MQTALHPKITRQEHCRAYDIRRELPFTNAAHERRAQSRDPSTDLSRGAYRYMLLRCPNSPPRPRAYSYGMECEISALRSAAWLRYRRRPTTYLPPRAPPPVLQNPKPAPPPRRFRKYPELWKVADRVIESRRSVPIFPRQAWTFIEADVCGPVPASPLVS